MELRREKVDDSLSERIIVGMIVSDKVLQELAPAIVKEYFSTAPLELLAQWCCDFYSRYRKSPKKNILDIFQYEARKHQYEVNEFIEILLGKIQWDQPINEDLLIDQAFYYFKTKAIDNTVIRVKGLLEKGKLADAEEVLTGFKRVSKILGKWVDPFDPEQINEVFLSEERAEHQLFRMPGALGELIGDFERGMFVGILGPMKRGKSWWLQEVSVLAMIAKLRVIFISLEMGGHQVSKRIYKRLTAYYEGDSPDLIYPVFDCKKNQYGTCKDPNRMNRTQLIPLGSDHVPSFSPGLKYKPCTFCRGTDNFQLATWFTVIHRDKLLLGKTRKMLRAIEDQYAPRYRFKDYPTRSANIHDILRDLQILEDVEGFIPDVIVVDYADILAPEDSRLTGRERLDETWQMLKNLAQVRKCVVFTASQTNRKAITKQTVTQSDTAEDIRKIAHVDMMLSLNQLPEEKRMGIMRIGLIAAREDDFDEYQHCMVLQQLAVGQPRLDSELVRDEVQSGSENN